MRLIYTVGINSDLEKILLASLHFRRRDFKVKIATIKNVVVLLRFMKLQDL